MMPAGTTAEPMVRPVTAVATLARRASASNRSSSSTRRSRSTTAGWATGFGSARATPIDDANRGTVASEASRARGRPKNTLRHSTLPGRRGGRARSPRARRGRLRLLCRDSGNPLRAASPLRRCGSPKRSHLVETGVTAMIDVGQTIGNYNVTAKLGEGGMGTVFLAEHPVIGSKVALKAIHPQYARDANMVSRFVTEAKSVNQIGHDHIVDITDFGHTADGDFYFIMEYLEGRSLADAITQDGPFPPARALTIAAQIADALSSSHEHGVIHRDLKPENIFLIVRDDTSDFVKVLDFGLAKLTHPDDPLRHDTGPGSVMGTPFYMAPEQCEGKADLDHRTGVYALGVIIFEMLTGMVPFGGRGYGEILI